MFDGNVFLEKVHIKNILSLRDVELPLKPLTVLVGPNASGKSNVLNALAFFNRLMLADKPPPVEIIQDLFWAGEANRITFGLQAGVGTATTAYELELEASVDNPFVAERLSVNGVDVISIQKGKGAVRDEDDKNRTTYKSNKLALRSAGDYGNKPITNTLTEFIMGWEFCDFQPDFMRDRFWKIPFGIVERTLSVKPTELREAPQLGNYGEMLSALLSYWHKNAPELFNSVSESLADSTNIRIALRKIDGDNQLCLLEGYKKPIPLWKASDGTLRLVAYYVLLNEPELPPLIAIEEPERNLHPGALADIAEVLEQIAQRTQVIITTHSPQLLTPFTTEHLSDSLGVLLLRNCLGRGTEVINLEEVRQGRAGLDGWITDFGVGSAIFHSELLQDLMEGPTCRT